MAAVHHAVLSRVDLLTQRSMGKPVASGGGGEFRPVWARTEWTSGLWRDQKSVKVTLSLQIAMSGGDTGGRLAECDYSSDACERIPHSVVRIPHKIPAMPVHSSLAIQTASRVERFTYAIRNIVAVCKCKS